MGFALRFFGVGTHVSVTVQLIALVSADGTVVADGLDVPAPLEDSEGVDEQAVRLTAAITIAVAVPSSF